METPMNFTSLEEEIYWKNFHFAQFSLVLPTDFQHSLALPKKFAHYMRSKLPDNVVLKVHGLTWNVSAEKCGGDVVLKGQEWQKFAEAYSLGKGDVLIFKYNQYECFEILIFDHKDSCEKEASYFVCQSQWPQSKNADSYRLRATSSEFSDIGLKGESADDDSDDFPWSKQGKRGSSTPKDRSSGKAAHAEVEIQKSDSKETSAQEISISEQRNTRKRAATPNVMTVPSNAAWRRKHNSEERTISKGCQRRYYTSNRRPVTEEEKFKALEMASKTSAVYLDSFFVVMRPTCVFNRFFMTIPHKERVKNHLRESQKLILQVRDKTWTCTYNRGSIEGGWLKFALDNSLEDFDVCLFAPTDPMDGMFAFDVSIFRAIPDIIPPTQADRTFLSS